MIDLIRHGALVREARHRTGLSQGAFAEKVGIDDTFLQRIETGKRQPSRATVAMICDAVPVLTPIERASIFAYAGFIEDPAFSLVTIGPEVEEFTRAWNALKARMGREQCNEATDITLDGVRFPVLPSPFGGGG